jgi:triosephosphate isomerase
MTKSGRRPLVAGNWKMNGLRSSVAVVEAVRSGLTAALLDTVDVLICPPSTLIASCVAAAYGSPIAIGGQNLHAKPNGAGRSRRHLRHRRPFRTPGLPPRDR